MFALDATGLSLLITAICGGIATIIAAIASVLAVVRVNQVHSEVKTMNELTLGQLGERRETRRIAAIDDDSRTAQEKRHMAMDVLDPHTTGVDKAIEDRKTSTEPGTAKAADLEVE